MSLSDVKICIQLLHDIEDSLRNKTNDSSIEYNALCAIFAPYKNRKRLGFIVLLLNCDMFLINFTLLGTLYGKKTPFTAYVAHSEILRNRVKSNKI